MIEGSKTVAIVGGGATGVLAAAAVLRRIGPGDKVVVIDPAAELGRGFAYSTDEPCHLLNARAGNMSAVFDEPDHFCRWLVIRGLANAADAPFVFASRRDYGTYLSDVLRCACCVSKGSLQAIRGKAVAFEAGPQLTVVVENGQRVAADAVVLATGHVLPCCPGVLADLRGNGRYLSNPWRPDALCPIKRDDSVFMVGSGLTMVDAFLTLTSRGHRGRLIARSRRGLLPQPHRLGGRREIHRSEVGVRTVPQMIRESGDDWRATIDGLRPHMDSVWQGLSWDEKSRVVRRLRPYWEPFRHRMPESVSASIQSAQESGQLSVGAGVIQRVREDVDGFEIEEGGRTVSVNWIVNCTGPSMNVQSAKVPILESAVHQGLASYDPLGMGLMVDDDGRTEPLSRVWTLGPLCRGCRWETTAVQEIRTQAERLAQSLCAPF